jgi:hypothetical protein
MKLNLPREEKHEIHRKNVVLSPYKAELVKLFYGNDVQEVHTYYITYHRPSKEDLERWHEILQAGIIIQNSKR